MTNSVKIEKMNPTLQVYNAVKTEKCSHVQNDQCLSFLALYHSFIRTSIAFRITRPLLVAERFLVYAADWDEVKYEIYFLKTTTQDRCDWCQSPETATITFVWMELRASTTFCISGLAFPTCNTNQMKRTEPCTLTIPLAFCCCSQGNIFPAQFHYIIRLLQQEWLEWSL